ncbi:MAG: alkaline phosphatase D [Polyangiales bacterium]
MDVLSSIVIFSQKHPFAILMPGLLWLLVGALAGCGDDDASSCDVDSDCAGREQCVDEACVPRTDAGPRVDAATDAAELVDAVVADAAEDATDAADANTPEVLVPADRPADLPPPSSVVRTVTITLETGTGEFAGTPNPTQVCFDDTCVTMDYDGESMTLSPWRTHVQHVEGLGLDADGVAQIRMLSGGENQYEPACLDVRFDGRPVHCGRMTDVYLSTDLGDVNGRPSWETNIDNGCVSCAGSTITAGPVLGLPSETSVSVWLRGDATRLYGLELALDADGMGATTVAYQYAQPADDYTVRFDPDGLSANTTYYYRVTVDDEAQGEFLPIETAPGLTDTVRIGLGSCAKTSTEVYRQQQTSVFGHLSGLNLDAFLFVGDSHYANAQTLSQHRDYLRDPLRIEARAALLARVPMAATWDDHDFLGNNTDGECAGRELALQAVQEYWPNPSFGLEAAPGTYYRHRLGSAELFVLDCRSYRPRLVNADGTDRDTGRRCTNSGDTIDDMAGGPLGTPQYDWLVESLQDSEAPFKLITCGSLITSNGVDSWNSFPDAREALYSSIHDAGVDGVVFLSGDIHRSQVRVAPRDDGYDFYEFVSSPLAQYSRAVDSRSECGLGGTTNGTEVLYCDSYNSFVELRVREDELSALYYNEEGMQRHAVVLSLSDLSNP